MSLKRHISAPLIGYALLAGGLGYAISAERTHSDGADRARAADTRRLLLAGCKRDNILRAGVSEVLIASGKRERGNSPEAVLEERRSEAFTKAQLPKFVQIDCRKVTSSP